MRGRAWALAVAFVAAAGMTAFAGGAPTTQDAATKARIDELYKKLDEARKNAQVDELTKKLKAARDSLRELLTVRQEGVLFVEGLLD